MNKLKECKCKKLRDFWNKSIRTKEERMLLIKEVPKQFEAFDKDNKNEYVLKCKDCGEIITVPKG